MSDRVSVFANGAQYGNWQARNCHDGCKKFVEEAEEDCEKEFCPIDYALLEAYFGDGCVTAEIAKRMGYTACNIYCWDCPEKE